MIQYNKKGALYLMQKKIDLRVIKTKANIKNSFVKLLKDKSLQEITVQNILDEALINRATFYNYYHDKFEVAEQLSVDFLKEFTLFVEKRFNADSNEKSSYKIIYELYDFVYENRDLVIVLLKIETEQIHLYKDMEQVLKVICLSHLKHTIILPDESYWDYFSTLYSAFVLTTIRWALNLNTRINVQELFEVIINFINFDILKK